MQDTKLNGIKQAIPAEIINFSDFAAEARNLVAQLDRPKDGNFKTKGFTEAIFNDLPPLLKIGADSLTDETDKNVFLMGAIGALSAIMPNVHGIYDGKVFCPNLYVYIVGSAGIGKGALSYALQLVMPIHTHLMAQNEGLEEGQSKKRLFIPANNSSAGAIKLLEENEGKGLIFETEGDTLANTFKSDVGNYSDTFRKAYGHERVAFYRKTNNEDIDIPLPKLSTVISSTFGQMLSLIPHSENGLFSRFLYYELRGNDDFKDVFANNKRHYKDVFGGLGDSFLRMYETLNSHPIEFDLSDEHRAFFMETFRRWKKEIIAHLDGNDFDGTTHRLGLMMFRLAMIFTIIRNVDNLTDQTKFVCSDVDFFNAFKIIEICKNNAIALYKRLAPPPYLNNKGNVYLSKGEEYDKVIELYKKGESLAQIAEAVFGDKKMRSKVQYWIDKFKKAEKPTI